MKTARIPALDGLRGVAIIAVLAFHFYYSAMPPRTAINFYPYNLGETILQYGRYGVELFFIISGFVISMTLHRCDSLREFAVKRFARLWPSMVLCSVLTFLAMKVWSGPQIQPNLLRNFLPSWTFLDPQLFTALTGERFYWMDRAYWSLFVEVRFLSMGRHHLFHGARSVRRGVCRMVDTGFHAL